MLKRRLITNKKGISLLLTLTLFFTLFVGLAHAQSELKSGMYIGGDVKMYYTFGEFIFGEDSLREDIAAQMTLVGYENVFLLENFEITTMQNVIDNNGINGTLETFLTGDLEDGYTDTEGNPVTTVPVVPVVSTTSVITADETDPSIAMTIDNANYISSVNTGDIVFDAQDSGLQLDNVLLNGSELIVAFTGKASANKDFAIQVKASGLDVAQDSDVLTFSINDYRQVVRIVMTKEPEVVWRDTFYRLEYYNMVITEHYSDGTTETVTFPNGTADGYSTDPVHNHIIAHSTWYTVRVTHNESGEIAETSKYVMK